MNPDELKLAFKRRSNVVWKGKKYALQGILAQWIDGRIVTSAILLDNNTDGRTIYQVKPDQIKEF